MQNFFLRPFFLAFFLFIYSSVQSQSSVAHSFTFAEITAQMPELRISTIEQILVSGDGTAAGDAQIENTLQRLLASVITSDDGKVQWHNLQTHIKQITIRNATFDTLPQILGEFRHLFEIVFDHCPKVNLQTVNNQVKKAGKDSNLFDKFNQDIISLTFMNADWAGIAPFQLEKGLMSDLRETRFINIQHLNQHCSDLLTQLYSAYPELGWLTIKGCGIDNTDCLRTLTKFEKLSAVSLDNNYLTEIPLFHKNLTTLNLSHNLISSFRPKTDSTNLNTLHFLYLDCNLFDYLHLRSVLSEELFSGLEVFTFECFGAQNDDEPLLLANALDRRRTAQFMSYTSRYVNDFTPPAVNCATCDAYRADFISNRLHEVTFQGDSVSIYRLLFTPAAGKVTMETNISVNRDPYDQPHQEVFAYKQIRSCQRLAGDSAVAPAIWEIILRIEVFADGKNKLRDLILRVPEGSTTGTLEILTINE